MNITYIWQINLSLKTNNKIVITNNNNKIMETFIKSSSIISYDKKKFFILIVYKEKNYPPKPDIKKNKKWQIPMFLNFSPWIIEINDW